MSRARANRGPQADEITTKIPLDTGFVNLYNSLRD
jgi:hypothetical protein